MSRDPSHSITDKVVRNTIFSVMRGVLSFLVVFFLTPFIISKIGLVQFGIWALANAVVSYAGLVDLGISQGLTKFVAQHKADGESLQINVLLSTSFVTYCAVSALAALVFFAARGWMVARFFRVDEHLLQDVNFVLLGLFIISIVNLSFGVFSSLLNGLQRMDLTSVVGMLSTFLNAVGIVIVLMMGFGLEGLLIAKGAATAAAVLGSALAAKVEFKPLRLNPFFFRLPLLRRLLGFGLQVQVVGLASLIHAQWDKVLLGYFVGLNSVAFYEVAGRIVNQLRMIPALILDPLMPAASEIQASHDANILQSLYTQSLKSLIILSLPAFFFVALFAYPLIELWLGPGYELIAFALQFLAIANFVNLLTGPGQVILAGVGKPRYGAIFSVAALLTHLVLSLILVIRFGYIGSVFGPTISMILWGVGFVIFAWGILSDPRRALRDTILLPLGASAVSLLTSYLLLRWGGLSATKFVFSAILFFSSYFLLLWKWGYIGEAEKRFLASLVDHATGVLTGGK